MSLLSERHFHKRYFIFNTSCHGYEGVMSVLCTALQIKVLPNI